MHTFSPTIAIVTSMNWGNLFSYQERAYHRKQTDPARGFDIQCRPMAVNTQVEPNFSSPNIPWEEWMTEKPGCYGHQQSDLTVSQPFTSVQTQHLQPLLLRRTLSSMKNLLRLIQAVMLGYSLGKAAKVCFCDRPHVTAAATHWHQGKSKVHLLLRILRNEHLSYLCCCHACMIVASPESHSMHSPGYFMSDMKITENFLYTYVVTLGHQISKQVVDKTQPLLLWLLGAHPAKLRLSPHSTSGTGLPGILSEPLAWTS